VTSLYQSIHFFHSTRNNSLYVHTNQFTGLRIVINLLIKVTIFCYSSVDYRKWEK